jgi:hypothetical protein
LAAACRGGKAIEVSSSLLKDALKIVEVLAKMEVWPERLAIDSVIWQKKRTSNYVCSERRLAVLLLKAAKRRGPERWKRRAGERERIGQRALLNR